MEDTFKVITFFLKEKKKKEKRKENNQLKLKFDL